MDRYSNYLTCLLFAFLTIIVSCQQEEGPKPDPDPGAENEELLISELLEEPVAVKLNPHGITPLAAEVIIRSRRATTVDLTIAGEIVRPATPANKLHELPILGLRAGTANQVILKLTDEDNNYAFDTLTIDTEPLPPYLPAIQVLTADKEKMEPGMTLVELNIGGGGTLLSRPVLFDTNGEVRWFMDLAPVEGDWAAPFERLRNGNWLFARHRNIYEYDMLGRQINRWQLDGYWQHHDAIEKPDGNLLIPVSKDGLNTYLDFIVEMDRQSGAVVREWDLRQVLDVDRYDYTWGNADWLHVNSVWYDESDEGLIISGRNQGVFKVSKDNELLWILAPHKGWEQAGPNGQGINTGPYLLQAVDENGTPFGNAVQLGTEVAPGFDWSWGQHAAMLLPGGHLLVFDNGWNRQFTYSGDDAYSRAVEYEIDPTTLEVRQVWQYGLERGPEMHAPNISDVDYLAQTGNRLLVPGNIVNTSVHRAKVIEVTYPAGEVVFEANVNFKNLQSNGGGWAQADIVYRGERVVLYPD